MKYVYRDVFVCYSIVVISHYFEVRNKSCTFDGVNNESETSSSLHGT